MNRTVPSRPRSLKPGFSPFADTGVSGFGGGPAAAAAAAGFSNSLSRWSLLLPLFLLCLPCLGPGIGPVPLVALMLADVDGLLSRQWVKRGSPSSSLCLLSGMRIARKASSGYSGPTTVDDR